MSRSTDLHLRARGRPVVVAVWTILALSGIASAQPLPLSLAPRYLVLPFENTTRDPRASWLGEASALLVTDGLLALQVPTITREARIRAFTLLRVPVAATLSHATVIRLGQLVGATEVVVGAFESVAEQLVVRARTIRLDTGRMSEDIVERGQVADLFAIQARMARRLAPPGRTLAEPRGRDDPPPISAFQLFVKGLLAESPVAKIASLTQALTEHPAFHRARLALWAVYTDQGEHQRALAMARQVPNGTAFSRQAQFLASVSMLHLGQYQGAYDVLTSLNTALADPAILNNLGIIRLRRPEGGPGGRAASYFTEAMALDNQDPDLLFNLGYAYWLDRDVPSAVTWLREAVRSNPADDAAHYVLGVALQSAGSPVEAAREKELAKRLSSEYDAWESRLAGANAAPRGLERVKDEVDVPPALRVEPAIAAAEQRDQREIAAFHLEAGRRAYVEGRDGDALSELRRATYLSPYESEAHLLLGRVHLRGRRFKEAIDALTISIWSQDTTAAHVVLAEVYLEATELTRARAELQIVMTRDPGNREARLLLDRLATR